MLLPPPDAPQLPRGVGGTTLESTALRMVFDRIDTSGDGLLQKNEVLHAVQNSDIVKAMLGASHGTLQIGAILATCCVVQDLIRSCHR